MPHNDRTRPAGGRTGNESVSGTTWSVPPGPDRLLVAGEWVTREPDWRERVTLADAEPHVIYAAGMRDGYDLAISELRDFAALLVDHLGLRTADFDAHGCGVRDGFELAIQQVRKVDPSLAARLRLEQVFEGRRAS